MRNFTASWFSVNMGTGVVSIPLHNMPYNGSWLYWLSVSVFCLNTFLFVTFLAISVLRYTLYLAIWLKMIRHPTQSLFLDTFPTGLATIVNMVTFVCVPAWGYCAAVLVGPLTACFSMRSRLQYHQAQALWWIDAVVSMATCMYLPFAM